jgi:hypothetical protein
MVTRGSIRGNGRQLGQYLLRQGENDSIRVLNIKGTSQPNDLKKSLIEMSLTTELSGRTKKGLYHVVINPAPEESYRMTDQDWIRAAEILEAETGFTGQPRTIVLHEKNSRIHAHVVWQRYSFERQKMTTNKFSRYAQNRARQTMEKEFAHHRTPQKNLKRPELRKLLSDLWQRHPAGKDFVAALAEHGYTVARSDDRRPIVVINKDGLSFAIDRDLKGVRTKLIQERLKSVRLLKAKTVIRRIRQEQKSRQTETDKDRMIKQLKQKLQRDPAKDKSRGR